MASPRKPGPACGRAPTTPLSSPPGTIPAPGRARGHLVTARSGAGSMIRSAAPNQRQALQLEHAAWVVPKLGTRLQAEFANALQPQLDRNPQLTAGQVRSRAAVHATAEC